MSQTSQKYSSSNSGNSKSTSSNNVASQPTLNFGKPAEVNFIQANPTDNASKGKKKGKGKAKADTSKQDYPKPRSADSSQCKPKYPCLICDDEHFTKEFPRRSEVIRLLKGTQGASTILKEPFP